MKPPDILKELNKKELYIGGFCTFKRQYNTHSQAYLIGKLQQDANDEIFIVDTVDHSYLVSYSKANIKLNYDNIKYIFPTTLLEKTFYKLMKLA